MVYWNNIPAPYMVERFNALVDRGRLEFEAWFNDRIKCDRNWIVDESNWRFRFYYMNTFGIDSRRLHFPLPLLKRKRPDVLVSLYAEPSFVLGWTIARSRGIKTGFWVETTFNRWVRRTAFKEAFKKWIFKKVDFIITVGRDGRDFAQRYGALKENIFFAPHGIDVAHYRDGSAKIRSKRSLLNEKIDDMETTFIYVGRMVKLKGLNYLLDAFKEVQRRSTSKVSLILVGNGADERLYRFKCEAEAIRNVHFTGFCQKSELPSLYAVADVFVFPTLGDPYGLVVDEAMACSMPIVTTNAAGEIRDRVEDGVNGYIVPPENRQALAEAMLKLVKDPNLRRNMGLISEKKIAGRSPQKWAEDFEKIVFYILDRNQKLSKTKNSQLQQKYN